MRDRLWRSRRVVRRFVTRRAPLARLTGHGGGRSRLSGVAAVASVLAELTDAADPAEVAEPCAASGWSLRLGCTDGNGGAICPLCSQPVRTRPDLAVSRPIQVIQEHCA